MIARFSVRTTIAVLGGAILAWAFVGTAVRAQIGSVEASSADPLNVAVRQLWKFVEQKCTPPEGKNWDVAVVGALPDNQSLSADEKELLALKLSSSFSELFHNRKDAKVRNYRELGDMILVMGSGESRSAVDEFLRKGQNDINLMIVVYGGRSAARHRLSLRALGFRGITCAEQTGGFDLPRGYLPEKVYTPDEFLSRAAQHVLERTKGRGQQFVWIRSRLTDGSPAPAVWNESLARSFNRAVPIARDRLPSRSIETTDIHAEASINYVEAKDWSTELTLDPYARDGAHLEVDVRPPKGASQEGVAFDGIVDRDKLPPLPSAAATEGLPLSTQTPRRFEATLEGVDRRREYAFSLPRSAVLEIDLQDVDGRSAPVVGVLDRLGKIIPSKDMSRKLRPYLQRWRLDEGRYSLWVQSQSSNRVRFTVRTRAAFDALTPEPVSQFGSVAGDWMVGGSDLPDGSRRCFAFTPALEMQPSDWRMQRPALLFQMKSSSDEVSHQFDGASEWRTPERIVAEVMVRDHWDMLPLSAASDGTLQSLEPCRGTVGASCIRPDTIKRLTDGRFIQMSGVTADGRPGTVRYSLNGYQAAMFAMARLCYQRDYGDRLILKH